MSRRLGMLKGPRSRAAAAKTPVPRWTVLPCLRTVVCRTDHRAEGPHHAGAEHQQRGCDGGHDEQQRGSGSDQGCPEAGLLEPGVDGVPKHGQANRAYMTSFVIPASHATGRYRGTGSGITPSVRRRHAQAAPASSPGPDSLMPGTSYGPSRSAPVTPWRGPGCLARTRPRVPRSGCGGSGRWRAGRLRW